MRVLSLFIRYVQSRRWLVVAVCLCGGVLLLLTRFGVPSFAEDEERWYQPLAYDRIVAELQWKAQVEADQHNLRGARLTGGIEHESAIPTNLALQTDDAQPVLK